MTRLSVEIPSELDSELEAAVERGDYSSKDEAVVQALEALRMPNLYSPAVVERLRELVSEADAGGPPQPWNVEDFLRQAHERLDREAK